VSNVINLNLIHCMTLTSKRSTVQKYDLC